MDGWTVYVWTGLSATWAAGWCCLGFLQIPQLSLTVQSSHDWLIVDSQLSVGLSVRANDFLSLSGLVRDYLHFQPFPLAQWQTGCSPPAHLKKNRDLDKKKGWWKRLFQRLQAFEQNHEMMVQTNCPDQEKDGRPKSNSCWSQLWCRSAGVTPTHSHPHTHTQTHDGKHVPQKWI